MLDELVADITAVNVKLEKLEAQIEEARAAGDKEEVAALRRKEEQLRREEEQLRAEKLLLLQHQSGALVVRDVCSCLLTDVCLGRQLTCLFRKEPSSEDFEYVVPGSC